jgi:hypothetical protein
MRVRAWLRRGGTAGRFALVWTGEGLLVTAIVAWSCYSYRERDWDLKPGPARGTGGPPPRWVLLKFSRPDWVRGTPGLRGGVDTTVYQSLHPDYPDVFAPGYKSITTCSAGWPCHALWAWQEENSGRRIGNPDVGGPNVGMATIVLPRRVPRWVPRQLMYLPHWRGLAIDTALYGAGSAAGWGAASGAFAALRRRGRARRGSCQRCGYDLVRIGTGEPCPECGARPTERRLRRFL